MILDLPLLVTCAGVMATLAVLHLALRPELRNGRKLSRLYAYSLGLGCYAAGVLILALWRGIVGAQAIMDVSALLVAAAIPPLAFRLLLGEPKAGPVQPLRTEDVQQAIADIRRNAQEAQR